MHTRTRTWYTFFTHVLYVYIYTHIYARYAHEEIVSGRNSLGRNSLGKARQPLGNSLFLSLSVPLIHHTRYVHEDVVSGRRKRPLATRTHTHTLSLCPPLTHHTRYGNEEIVSGRHKKPLATHKLSLSLHTHTRRHTRQHTRRHTRTFSLTLTHSLVTPSTRTRK